LEQLDRIRVATPCPVSWEEMTGDNRVRFCGECQLNVYNFAELTRTEAEDLLRTAEGRICGRLYRRADGTILTKDCPVGLRAVRRRVAKVATAAFAALVSLASAAAGQKQSDKDKACKQQVRITTKVEKDSSDRAKLIGTLLDQNGAVIAGAEIKVINHQTKETESFRSNDEGQFSKRDLAAGVYDAIINAPGFKELKVRELKIASGETVVIQAILLVNVEVLTGVVGLMEEPLSTSDMTIFKGDLIRKLPKP
jgi:hypothetical protein